ncbi:MAG: AAA family ATPase [Desulfobulbus sp.]|jgi:MoxR-like ATPase|uniref:AAA family ATPase n=1 Tax=Desulfobulbus sp. TaxID=895 RepID=UPI00284DA3B7|nr:MoxR family ATPase [Desulfobulbus sp.]MDR2551345.1 AAA family ATPase [Desulfobulbus sp.]
MDTRQANQCPSPPGQSAAPTDVPAKALQLFAALEQRLGVHVLGKEEQIRLSLCCLLARGHLLIEDIPGIGKTTLAKALAKVLGLKFRRVQCTNDMLPGDILGVSVFDQRSGLFSFHPGAIFTQILLVDEINRATAKTQSALLEAMEERQVSIEGESRPLPAPFFVVATQNPLEQAGTYPLPESQLDRFLMKISLGYPNHEAERQLLVAGGTVVRDDEQGLVDAEVVFQLQEQVSQVRLSQALVDYLQDILNFSRNSGRFAIGLSPRAGLSLARASQSHALLHGRNFVLPEDVRRVLPYIAIHRLKTADSLAALTIAELEVAFQAVPVPA